MCENRFTKINIHVKRASDGEKIKFEAKGSGFSEFDWWCDMWRPKTKCEWILCGIIVILSEFSLFLGMHKIIFSLKKKHKQTNINMNGNNIIENSIWSKENIEAKCIQKQRKKINVIQDWYMVCVCWRSFDKT